MQFFIIRNTIKELDITSGLLSRASTVFRLFMIFLCLFVSVSGVSAFGEFELGIDRIDAYYDIFKGKRVGLITNQTGINAKGVSSVKLLQEKCNLVCLFSPEHGLGGYAREGAAIGNSNDSASGLTVYSLYGKNKRPTEEQLENIDVLCFDIQDVGARFYTYISTMAYAMESCVRYNKHFVVFDRPNPIGDAVEGTILEMEYRSFTGYFPIVQRHGMTVGELAQLFNEQYGIGCNLTVIPMKNWNRKTYFEENHLMWVPPSPNIPTSQTALVYAGVCLFEGTNLSVGRGTTKPFEYIGAPFIDSYTVIRELNMLDIKGVRFLPVSFEPSQSWYEGQVCNGIYIAVTDRQTFQPVKTAVQIFYTLKKLYPKQFKINHAGRKYCGLNLLTGCSYFTDGHTDPEDYLLKMKHDAEVFKKIRKKYLLY